MFRQVPVLPVVVPIAAAAFVVLLSGLARRRLLSLPRAAVALALCVYAAGIVAHTVFPIYLDKPAYPIGWRAFLTLTPLVGYGGGDALMNVCVFLPLGVLLALAVPRATPAAVVAMAAGVSAGIEATQWVTAVFLGGGHIADVNDFGCDVIGAAIGVALLSGLSRTPDVSRWVDRFRWQSPVGVAKPDAVAFYMT